MNKKIVFLSIVLVFSMCTGVHSIDSNCLGKRMLYHADIGEDNLKRIF